VLAAGLLTTGFSCILQLPTGAGKTWLAEQAIRAALARGRRAVYLAPLRALAAELGARWRARLRPHRVGVFTGDPAGTATPFEEARLLVMTPERLDACTRSWRAHWRWLPEVELVVADELHLLGERRRGARLEGALLRTLRLNPFARVLGLSATLGNRLELAGWLDAVERGDDRRPVPLRWRTVTFRDPSEKPSLTAAAVAGCVAGGGRSLVFVQSRRRAEELAGALRSAGLRAEHHHGGLERRARAAIEARVRSGAVEVAVATATLELGVNFPVRQVVLHDLQVWSGDGFVPLSVNSAWQRAGRAGRPGLDDAGEVVLVAPAWARPHGGYAEARFEPIRSRLGEPAELAEQLVAEVASGLCRSAAQLESALARSLAAHQGRLPPVRRAVRELVAAGMLAEVAGAAADHAPRLRATPLGHVAARHLLAPATLLLFDRALRSGPLTFLDLLLVACASDDAEPVLPVDHEALDALAAAAAAEPSHLLRRGDAEVRALLAVPARRALAGLHMAMVLRALTRAGDPEPVASAQGCYPHEVARLQESAGRLLLAFEAVLRARAADAEAPPHLVDLLRRLTALRRMVVAALDEAAATLTFVPGLGPRMARRLVAAGIRHLEDLALSTAAELAGVRGLSAGRATRWIAAAEALLPARSAAALAEDAPGAALAAAPGSGSPGPDPYRLRRALALTVARHGDRFEVTGGLEPHRATLTPAPRCDCADFARGNTCKHLLAIRLAVGEPALRTACAALSAGDGTIDLHRWWSAPSAPLPSPAGGRA
jgi:helicase